MFLMNQWAFRRSPELGEAGGVPPAPEKKNEAVEQTKAFSARLAQKTEQVRKEERERIAKENGYESYDKFIEATREARIKKETNYDTTEEDFQKLVKIIKEDTDPEKEELKAKLKAYEESEAEKWEREQLALLESTWGVKVSSLSELDADVQARIAKGIDPVDAYYLVHKPKPKFSQEDDKAHLKGDPKGTSSGSGKGTISADELARLREFLPDLTDEQIIEKVKKSREKQ